MKTFAGSEQKYVPYDYSATIEASYYSMFFI